MREFFAPFYPKDAKRRFIAMMRGYFDDSGTHAQSPIVVAAGIIISDEQHDLMKETWDAILQRNHLKHFHTTRLKSGKVPPYSAMTEAEREVLLDQLVGLMSVRVAMSFACAVPRSAYDAAGLSQEEKARYGSPYAFAAQLFWTCLRLWAERYDYTDPIPFVSESGNDHQRHLSVVFEKGMADPVLKKLYRLHSLTIGGKEQFVGLQAADIVAKQHS